MQTTITETEFLDTIKRNIHLYRKKVILTSEICEVPPIQNRSIWLVHLVLDAVFKVASTKTVFELTGETIIGEADGKFKRTNMYRYYNSLEEMFVAAYNRELFALVLLFKDYQDQYIQLSEKSRYNVIQQHLGQLEMIIQSVRSFSTTNVKIPVMHIGGIV